ncbi:hypothetical protein PFICI_11657 [Pestalotiopsis fici W106-1]|uniref:DUF7702 domain-containing protein n=1 Tax=Pestalotiopsis fici (strain W106-1 / CGMCC3.15140) TaxID=1229662 RepID=W3WQY1_PESFW|nr:uncharacterized protein PFICI_11657 [Pestalotiopsis fici W106-1]ETS76270.1 hypothetical protein PFICI_11657 [Pestalotiopsis fici W106-1]
MSTDHSLPAAILAIDILLSFPAIYNIFKHGLRHGAILGWAYFFIFLTLRIVSSALQLSDSKSSTASLVASIGLSPLLLATLGLVHESRSYVFDNLNRKTEGIWVLVLHILITGAVALTAAGASGMSKPDITDAVRTRDKRLVTVGMVALLVSWILVTLVAATSFVARPRANAGNPDIKQGNRLLYAVLFAIPFLGIRILVSLVYFATMNQDLSPVTGKMGYKVGLGFIEELLISIAFVAAGIMTRNIGKSRTQKVSTQEAAWGR